MKSKRFVAFMVVAVMLLVLVLSATSCGEKGSDTIVIGLTAPFSGGGAEYGEDCKTGMEMGIKDINEAGGVELDGKNYMLELSSLDDEAVPDEGVKNAKRFVTEQNAKIVYCPVATVIYRLMDINEREDEEFLIMAYTSVKGVTEEDNTLIAMIPPPYTIYTELFTNLAMQQGWTKLAMVQTTGAYGDAWAAGMGTAWKAAGGDITTHARSDYYTETDFVPFLTKALASNPDVLLVGGPTQPTALIVEQAKGLGFKGGFIVMDQAKIDGMAEQIGIDKMENCIGVAPVEEPFPATPEWSEKYEQEYNRTATWESAINYTSMFILKNAIEKAGTADDPNAIRNALAEALPVSGDEFPVGIDGIEDTGLMHMPSAITLVKNGEYTMANDLIYWWENGGE